MTPGTYLRKRREAMRLGVRQAAANLAASPWAVKRATPTEINRLMQRILAAEEDREPFSLEHALLLRNVFSLDVGVYEALLALHLAGADTDLPHPQVCRGCACSWNDACITDRGACSWAEAPRRGHDGLCTACLRKLDLSAELGPTVAPRVIGRCFWPQASKANRPSGVSPEAEPGGCPAPAFEAQSEGAPA